ncbi:Tub family-domain-containing protein [Pelagophyceae sp. CCMP2097]|nr:Tub family-domain-containing protein [Pelagophyceae sp. CCMP2097]
MTADDFGDYDDDKATASSAMHGLSVDDADDPAESKFNDASRSRRSTKERPASATNRKTRVKKNMAPPIMAPPDDADDSANALYGDADASASESKVNAEAFGISGALPESTQSRARALAKQRELQMKRRQQSMQSGAMMRGAGSGAPSPAGSFTPGVAQFSAPRAIDDDPYGPFSANGRAAAPWRPSTATDYTAGPLSGGGPATGANQRAIQDTYDERHGARRGGDAYGVPARPQTATAVYQEDTGRYERPLTSRPAPAPQPTAYSAPQLATYSPPRDDRAPAAAARSPANGRSQRDDDAGRDRRDDRRSDDDRDARRTGRDTLDGDRDGDRGRNSLGRDPRGRDATDRDTRDRDRHDRGGDRRFEASPQRRASRPSYDEALRSGGDHRRDDDDDRRDDQRDRDRDYDDYDRRDDRQRGGAREPARGGADRDRCRDDEDDDRRDDGRGSGRRRRRSASRDGDRGGRAPASDGRDRRKDDYDDYTDDYDSRGGRGGRDADRPPRRSDDDDDDRRGGGRAQRRAPRDGDASPPREGATAELRDDDEPRGVTVATPEFDVTALPLHDMRLFLTAPTPQRAGIVQCYIKRNRAGTNKLFPEYSVYMKEGDRFMMCSKKRPNNKTSNYLISMGEHDLKRNSPNYIGKLRANFAGTEFQIFDAGWNPKDLEPDADDDRDKSRAELGAIIYTSNVLGSRGPRKMQVAMPKIGLDDRPAREQGAQDILYRMKAHEYPSLVHLINKPPRWNDHVGARAPAPARYVLNFNGRVTMASVKNFQLVQPDEQEIIMLQFGRVGKDEFTMDFQWPVTPFQAFAITLSSFDSKIACD